MTLKNRFNYVMSNEDAFSFTEYIVWVAVILALAVPLYLFRDAIEEFFAKAIGKVGSIGPKY